MLGRKDRFGILDAILIIATIVVAAYIFYRIKLRLHYNWDWKSIPRYLVYRDDTTGALKVNYLLEGLITTIKLSLWSMLLATIIGTFFGLLRTSSSLFNKLLGTTYVEAIRNLPPLVLVFIFYFFVSDQIMPLLGVDEFIRAQSGNTKEILEVLFVPTSLFTQFISAIVTIAIFEGAYITEIVRSGIESIERGQREASYALGLNWFDQMKDIILPQAIKRILPPMANQFISTVKDTSIVAAISIQELTFQGLQLSTSTHLVFEVWITVTVLYLLITYLLSFLVGRMEIRMRRSD